jgi:hypothetical protein
MADAMAYPEPDREDGKRRPKENLFREKIFLMPKETLSGGRFF